MVYYLKVTFIILIDFIVKTGAFNILMIKLRWKKKKYLEAILIALTLPMWTVQHALIFSSSLLIEYIKTAREIEARNIPPEVFLQNLKSSNEKTLFTALIAGIGSITITVMFFLFLIKSTINALERVNAF